MSRVGKNPVVIPAGVTIELKGQHLKAKGKRGELQLVVHDDVLVAKEDEGLVFKPRNDSRRARMQWGTARNLASNVVRGVSDGFTINLEINGVGYRAAADAKMLKMQLGFSHDVEIPIPAGIEIKAVKPTEIAISGSDRQRVGQIAAEIRSLRPPEPYKGKGIKYSTETIRRKEGKKK
ncbi:50S ribosomal protein L6 [Reyranella sp.]|jgi:large subunit ribosomal protein L6|uniref:50S ribosomal protein L6 n=1 Tax=Reyranella sp. TaxID=1929291 RepID=UPI000BD0A38E|nr:50S ribosomal protein L6 [Reyranella sp.]OYY40406.1 MAG: 50S ribosomal protein L6 [Rhodospirillales bacterium 35-66-84]OYZ93022.1 MAG: 50S ribosomal protein L6 [Rhodospirillales bacterium 24-66-33]OZB24151.1 MAG: 50S ribosomal protein L6 [Rhodospirillales bacterium 39-66-50]HQS18743.1 50S ribosomal protein L6 [Reyranella sp.]HQT14947.1 50S ribosomal protein L6 [Reyranella sp.]